MDGKELAKKLYQLIEMAQFKHPIIAEELKESADDISSNLHIIENCITNVLFETQRKATFIEEGAKQRLLFL